MAVQGSPSHPIRRNLWPCSRDFLLSYSSLPFVPTSSHPDAHTVLRRRSVAARSVAARSIAESGTVQAVRRIPRSQTTMKTGTFSLMNICCFAKKSWELRKNLNKKQTWNLWTWMMNT